MKDDQLDDLKQFIDSRISQSEVRLEKKLDYKIDELRTEVHDGFTGVGDAIEEIHTQIDKTNTAFDSRLTKLEQQSA